MAEQTKNLNLSKPSLTDGADIRVLNNNFDILDKAIGDLQVKGNTKNNIFMNNKEFVTVVEKSGDGDFWYVKYSDGSLLQGGIIKSQNTVLTFPTAFANENYFICVGALTNHNYASGGIAFMYDVKNTTGISGLKTSCGSYTANYNGWCYTLNRDTTATLVAPHWLCVGEWK